MYLIDTNVLLRIFRQDDPQHQLIGTALEELNRRGVEACFTLQNIAEFWNVCTRPANQNGYGLSTDDANLCAEYIERTMTFLPDNEKVYSIWRQLVVANKVRGVKVHDARLVAIMQVYGVSYILTLNDEDFQRYANIQPIHPAKVQPSAP